jgi:hypothetical protein
MSAIRPFEIRHILDAPIDEPGGNNAKAVRIPPPPTNPIRNDRNAASRIRWQTSGDDNSSTTSTASSQKSEPEDAAVLSEESRLKAKRR